MKVLAVERPVPSVEEGRFTEDLLRDEAAKVWELQQSGILRECYFRADRREAVLVLECGSGDEAQRHLADLPLVRAGMIQFEVIQIGRASCRERV